MGYGSGWYLDHRDHPVPLPLHHTIICATNSSPSSPPSNFPPLRPTLLDNPPPSGALYLKPPPHSCQMQEQTYGRECNPRQSNPLCLVYHRSRVRYTDRRGKRINRKKREISSSNYFKDLEAHIQVTISFEKGYLIRGIF